MIVQSVSLASNGVVKVPGYEHLVRFGYTKNRGVYRLAVTASGEWEGLTIRAFWHVPDSKDPASSLIVDGSVDVPASVTAQPGNGCITFEGSDGTKTVTSADLRYRVSANSGTEDGTEPEPGTPAWQQLVDAVHTNATAADRAKTDAQTAAQQAEESAQKAGKALSDTITAKEDALKAIGDKQTAATQAVDTARDKALQQVKDSTEAAQTAATQAVDTARDKALQQMEASKAAAQTAASEAATSAGNADQSAQQAAGSLQELKDGIASGEFKGEPGNDGKSPVVTVTAIENGHRIRITDKDGTKTIDVLNGQIGKTGATPVLTIGTVSSGDKPSADITGTPENPVLNLRLQPGPQGPAVALDTTLTHEGEAADAKATGDAISAVKARQNILIGTETGNPIAINDAFSAPLCGLTVYGKSTQDGTPTPDTPVPIVSAGDGGSVAVKVTGKNLLDFLHAEITKTGWRGKFTRDEEILTVSAVNGWESYWFVSPVRGKQISVSFTYRQIDDKTGDTSQALALGTSAAPSYMRTDVYHVDSPKKSWTKVACTMISEAYVGMMLRVANESVNEERTIEIKDFQLELGSTATTYSPYREQLLTLPTPTGLPGIPVTSGGNYTDPQGQQWVCDEVDLDRGVKVQRIASFVINAKNVPYIKMMNEFTNITVATNARLATPQKTNREDRNYRCVFCEALPWVKGTWASPVNGIGFVKNDSVDFTIENSYLGLGEASTNDERKNALVKYFTDNPCRVVYRIATPIETPLTPAEIVAYKALTAYGPDTVVQAGDGAGIRLEYQRDVNIAIKRIEDAVASMTTT